jgi:hypothetical protein
VKEAAEWMQERTGHRPGIPSIYRWILKGVRGVRLASEFVGGVRLISINDLEGFLRACNERLGDTSSTPVVHASPPRAPSSRYSLRRKQIHRNTENLRRQFGLEA